jgi:hypothetical protein
MFGQFEAISQLDKLIRKPDNKNRWDIKNKYVKPNGIR